MNSACCRWLVTRSSILSSIHFIKEPLSPSLSSSLSSSFFCFNLVNTLIERRERRTVGCNSRGSFCLFCKRRVERNSMSAGNDVSKRGREKARQIIDFGFSFHWRTATSEQTSHQLQQKKRRKSRKRRRRRREDEGDTENSDPSRDKLVNAVSCATNARRLLMCAFVC